MNEDGYINHTGKLKDSYCLYCFNFFIEPSKQYTNNLSKISKTNHTSGYAGK